MFEKITKLRDNLIAQYKEFRGLPMKWRLLIVCVPLLLGLVALTGCSINTEFLDTAEKLNKKTLIRWKQDLLLIPEIANQPEQEREKIVNDMMTSAHLLDALLVRYRKGEKDAK